ncbi:DNA ligase [Vibrio sp. M260118]|uniref:DNA ligase n=1 Tax=Vibrio sp. M260118 TaxID=3020896 RepID=UPI002F4155A7
MDIRLSLLAISLLSASTPQLVAKESIAGIQSVALAETYNASIDVGLYWVSEKLDGVRAIWNGKQLVTRNGIPIAAPDWFIENMPDVSIEGELWAGRGNFHLVQQTVLDTSPNDNAWKGIKLMLFDMPNAPGTYQQRYAKLIDVVNNLCATHVGYVEHKPIISEHELLQQLDSIDGSYGEGLMLRKIDSLYTQGRSSDLIKLKKYQDAEARVIGYKSGNGKYEGKMGSLLVQLESGQQFYIGSGFSDSQREEPPRIGTIITFRYNGYTHKGIPKFARYLRERVE